ncbi:MAG: hypothetical protein R2838_19860 [Caldilineaceae bacterium]
MTTQTVYAHPDYLDTLATSTPISDHVFRGLRAARLSHCQAPVARSGERISTSASPT